MKQNLYLAQGAYNLYNGYNMCNLHRKLTAKVKVSAVLAEVEGKQNPHNTHMHVHITVHSDYCAVSLNVSNICVILPA